MNNGNPLTFDCNIKDGEVWELIDKRGKVFECDGVNVLELNRDSETLVLRKYTTAVPTTFALHPAYPNPFNPITTIHFSVGAMHASSLNVYDITGRLVETLVDEILEPGQHTTQWNANTFFSGVYFVRLEAGSFHDTQKVILLK